MLRLAREFTTNSATTEIVQNNRYRHADGRSRHKQWSYNFKDHNQRDGFAHPASIHVRSCSQQWCRCLVDPIVGAKPVHTLRAVSDGWRPSPQRGSALRERWGDTSHRLDQIKTVQRLNRWLGRRHRSGGTLASRRPMARATATDFQGFIALAC